ncbi:MAG TPA: DUF4124 domain-containing protein [Stenotrophomonas sp.]|jgi:hypothetical protein
MRLSTGLCGLLLLAAASAGATDLYKWKDANGVTHFTETPPPTGQRYEARRIDNNGGLAVAESADPTPESPRCLDARKNLKVLAEAKHVMQDTDGDGKGDVPLEENQRAAQRELGEAAIKAYCPPAGT